MKYIKQLGFCIMLLMLHFVAAAQQPLKLNLRGEIIGSYGEPIAGATIISEVDDVSVTSDESGSYSLVVTQGAMLTINAPGFLSKLVEASTDLSKIELLQDRLEQPIKTIYQSTETDDLMGGKSNVDMRALLDKSYSTYALDNLEGLVGGISGTSLWGYGGALILVDGIPRDASSVLPVEIGSVTYLKGASAVALYGSRGANGVILISTKRGSDGDKTIEVRTNAGIYVPRSYPKYLGGAEYMSLYNEAQMNDGTSPENVKYSESDIYYTAAGDNPYVYPDLDFYSSDYLKEAASRYDATVQISGGNQRAKYYTNIGYYTEGSLLDVGNAKESNRIDRVNVRGNVDVNINKNLTAKVNAAAIYYFGKGVNSDFWNGASTIRPNENNLVPLIPLDLIEPSDVASLNLLANSQHIIDGKYFLGGTQLNQTNPIADAYAAGTNTFNSRQFQYSTEINADLGDLLKGLSFTTMFGVDYSASYILAFNNQYATYEPVWNEYSGKFSISGLTKLGQDASNGEQSSFNRTFRQTLSLTSVLGYNRQFKGKHNVSASLSAGGFQQSFSQEYHRTSNANLGMLFSYNFQNKYYGEFSGAIVHSAKLPEKNRQAFNPTMSVGWRLSNEGFLANSSVVDNLKLFASAGIIHTDLGINDFYLYNEEWNQVDGYYFTWKDGLPNRSTDSQRGPNPDMVFPRREEISLGLEASLFDNTIEFNGSYFVSRMTGMIVQNAVLFPSQFQQFGYPSSNFLPFVNYNNDLRTGVDLALNYNQRVGEIDFSLGLTGNYFDTKASKRAEIVENDYQLRQDKPLDAIWGLENEGFFSSQTDIENWADQSPIGGGISSLRPGDIKYKDQNGDGIINNQDEVYLGKGGWFGAPLTMGMNLTVKWRDLTFFALGVLRTGASAMKNNNYFWVNGEDKYSEVVQNRWTPETANTADYPRLTTSNGDNNFRNSDFWLYSTNRFDLSRTQVTYNFPERILGNGFIRDFSIYANGSNLLTIAPNKDILLLNIGSAPQMRFYNLGVTARF